MVVTVTINGHRGEGKSTLARKLVEFLEANDVACFVHDGPYGALNAHVPAHGCKSLGMVKTKYFVGGE